jgi:hypothetical protein
MKYEAIERRTRESILQSLDSGDPDEIHRALDSAAYWDPDWRWAQEQLLRFANAEDEKILSAVALGFTFLAVFHGEVDEELVIPVLERLKANPRLRGMVEDVEADIEHYVRTGDGR